MEVLDLGPHPAAQAGVEVAERLVEQEDQRLLDERATQRHALLLPARHLARLALQEVGDVERRGDRVDPVPDLGRRPMLELEPERDVVERVEVRVERVVLEHHRHAAFVWRRERDVLVAEQDPALVEPVETRRSG